ncbi:S1 family peptidase [Streptomyces sp. RB6PN25]|uniref:S1 family peptidase n=1 Tax=Streptomyces humicola TaxID=2953240 RepID=A0ABT1PQV6_9ACTN|nr:trypsin-like serine protease [Streptomyces humicola]MCQ4080056.1 S1 family peptidase [Streptomyces humicola]
MSRSSRSIALRGLCAVLLGLLTTVVPGPSASAADRPPPAPSAAAADSYWTAQRMEAAQPAPGGAVPVPFSPSSAAGIPGDVVPPSHPFDGLPQVGTFFWTDGNNVGRFCGATVVRSPGRDLVVSAGHCLSRTDPKRYLSFVPQYHDGLKPHGIFPVQRIYIDPRYYALGSGLGARWDYSVVQLGPRADGTQAEDVVGGFDLAVYPGFDHPDVRLIGYPGFSDTLYPKPLDCHSSTQEFVSNDPGAPGDFLQIACAGYIDGTSGGPFLVHDPLGYALIGVIGGYHTGGDTPDISYSSYFTADTLALYVHAVRGDPPATP